MIYIRFLFQSTSKLSRSRAFTVPFIDRKQSTKFFAAVVVSEEFFSRLASDGIYRRATTDIK